MPETTRTAMEEIFTSLISNALFALVLGCLFTLGLVLSARVVYLPTTQYSFK